MDHQLSDAHTEPSKEQHQNQSTQTSSGVQPANPDLSRLNQFRLMPTGQRVDVIKAMQHTHGNRAVQRFLSGARGVIQRADGDDVFPSHIVDLAHRLIAMYRTELKIIGAQASGSSYAALEKLLDAEIVVLQPLAKPGSAPGNFKINGSDTSLLKANYRSIDSRGFSKEPSGKKVQIPIIFINNNHYEGVTPDGAPISTLSDGNCLFYGVYATVDASGNASLQAKFTAQFGGAVKDRRDPNDNLQKMRNAVADAIDFKDAAFDVIELYTDVARKQSIAGFSDGFVTALEAYNSAIEMYRTKDPKTTLSANHNPLHQLAGAGSFAADIGGGAGGAASSSSSAAMSGPASVAAASVGSSSSSSASGAASSLSSKSSASSSGGAANQNPVVSATAPSPSSMPASSASGLSSSSSPGGVPSGSPALPAAAPAPFSSRSSPVAGSGAMGHQGASSGGFGRLPAPDFASMALPMQNQKPQVIDSWDSVIDAGGTSAQVLGGILRMILGRPKGTEVASSNVSLSFGIGAGLGLDSVSLQLVPTVSVGGTINTQDDRRLRTGLSLSLGLNGGLDASKAFKGSAGGKMLGSLVAVFPNEEALAAELIIHVKKLFSEFAIFIADKGSQFAGYLKEKLDKKRYKEYMTYIEVGLKAIGTTIPRYDIEQYPSFVTTGGLSTDVSGEVLGGALSGEGSASVASSGFQKYKLDKNGQLAKYAKAKNATTLSISASITGEIPIPGSPQITIGASYTSIKNHANPDNDGGYINVSLGLGGVFASAAKLILEAANSPGFLDALEGLFSGEDSKKIVSKDVLLGLIRRIPEFLGTAFSAGAAGAASAIPKNDYVEASVSNSVGEEFNFIRTGRAMHRLQYARLKGETELEVKAKGKINVGPHGEQVVLGGSFTASRMRGMGEILGNNTLTYIHTVYNGLMLGGKTGKARWENYRDEHQFSLDRIFLKIGQEKSNVRDEVTNSGVKSADALKNITADYANAKTSYGAVMDVFETYLAEVSEKTKAQANEGWVKVNPNIAHVFVDARMSEKRPRIVLFGYKGPQDQKPSSVGGALNAENQVQLRLFFTGPERKTRKYVYIIRGGADTVDGLLLQDRDDFVFNHLGSLARFSPGLGAPAEPEIGKLDIPEHTRDQLREELRLLPYSSTSAMIAHYMQLLARGEPYPAIKAKVEQELAEARAAAIDAMAQRGSRSLGSATGPADNQSGTGNIESSKFATTKSRSKLVNRIILKPIKEQAKAPLKAERDKDRRREATIKSWIVNLATKIANTDWEDSPGAKMPPVDPTNVKGEMQVYEGIQNYPFSQ